MRTFICFSTRLYYYFKGSDYDILRYTATVQRPTP
jgi:hypothetical protein